MPLGSGDADPARGTAPLKPKPGLNEPSSQAGIAGSVVTAAQLLPLGPPSVKRAHGSGRARASAFSNVRETLPVSICNFRGSTGFGYVGHLAVALWQIRINVSVFVCALNCEE